MSQPKDLLDAIVACRFCVLGETGPLLCSLHAKAWRCNACPDGLSRHPGLAHGCARCGHAVSHTPGCIDLTCSCPGVIPPRQCDGGNS